MDSQSKPLISAADLRAEARRLENALDAKLALFARLAGGEEESLPLSVCGSSASGGSERSASEVQDEIEGMLGQLHEVNDMLSRHYSSSGSATSVTTSRHVLQRHREILHDLVQEFIKIKSNFRTHEERHELLSAAAPRAQRDTCERSHRQRCYRSGRGDQSCAQLAALSLRRRLVEAAAALQPRPPSERADRCGGGAQAAGQADPGRAPRRLHLSADSLLVGERLSLLSPTRWCEARQALHGTRWRPRARGEVRPRLWWTASGGRRVGAWRRWRP
mmetsp:Transcript_10277/g.23785  ORF Transcript_10277/g.23785 Transcript_10277/m.23785 type:complete len:276 (+) Transcript_10277:28-855(+)